MSYNIELTLFTDEVNGIELTFVDCATSLTVPEVFKELRNDRYGLEVVDITPEDVIIDVGANVGMFSIYANKKFGCKIIAFEPVKESYDNFKRNLLLNHCNPDDFEIYNLAVTDKDDDTVIIGLQEWNMGGSSIFYNNPIRSQSINTTTLGKYITDTCRYLKLDCEGSEHQIVPNILDKLNTFKYVGIEYHTANNTDDPVELSELLRKNFHGEIFPEKIAGYIKIQSHFL